jgi:hypothetical protein
MSNDGMARERPGLKAAYLGRDSDGLTELDQRFGRFPGLLEDVVAGPPPAWPAKDDNCGSTETEELFSDPLSPLWHPVPKLLGFATGSTGVSKGALTRFNE